MLVSERDKSNPLKVGQLTMCGLGRVNAQRLTMPKPSDGRTLHGPRLLVPIGYNAHMNKDENIGFDGYIGT